jgi:hypothetical protein
VEAHGDLVISSWPGPGVQVDADSDTYQVLGLRGQAFALVFHDDAELALPPGLVLELIHASGDVEVDGLSEPLLFQHILGDLSLANIAGGEVASVNGDCSAAHVSAGLTVRSVSGDFEAEDVAGQLTVDNVNGDVQLDGVAGSVTIRSVSGDFQAEGIAGALTVDNVSGCVELDGGGGSVTVRNTGGDFTASGVQGPLQMNNAGGDLDITAAAVSGHLRAGGDAAIVLSGPDLQPFQVEAGGDIDLQLPAGAAVSLSMKSGGRTMELNLAGGNQVIEKHAAEVTLGAGGPAVRLRCGGDICVSDATPPGGASTRPTLDFNLRFDDQINRRTQEKISQAQQKADEAMRRLDLKMRGLGPEIDAAVQAGLAGSRIHVPDPFASDRPRPPRPAPAREPVTDEERLMILQMVQDKKISVEEAEKLLEALDGKA